MAYNFRKAEKEMQDFWEKENVYMYKPDAREIFSIDTPPPTVSGSLHIGHIFSYTQAEIVARFMRMQGKNVFYPFGFDNNGLPSERLTENDSRVKAASMLRGEFTALCRETCKKYVGEFKDVWKSMGFSVDWNLQYETIQPKVQKLSQSSFIRLAKSGKAYLKETPVLFCTNCHTSIAQAELDTCEKDSLFITIPFVSGRDTLPVATTRPELLYGCVCLFINPADKRYARFIGKTVKVPLYGFSIPVFSDEKADMEKGTGIVMCATFGDVTDLEWYEKHNLPYKKVMEPDGRISGNVPFVGGMKAAAAREKIIGLLNENGLLIKSEPIRHTVSVHERCGKEVEIIPSKQWFIEILAQKERFLQAADEINWYPPSMKTRYRLWVQNLKWDWCISRQRFFGVPFPVWYCKKCGAAVYADDSQLPVNPLESKPLHPCGCGCDEFIPETAVMDTWATSSLTPFINRQNGAPMPMSMRTQAHEIIRTWAFYTIVRSLYETGTIPWKNIMVCGFVLAKKGEKLSKSKGNAVESPKDMITRYSADALRYWSASANLGTDTVFSAGEIKTAARFITKLWNAANFCLMRLKDYRPESPSELMPVDRWILLCCSKAQKTASEYLNRYETGAARHVVDDLFWKDFCDTYLELVKSRLYNPELYSKAEYDSALYCLYRSFLMILKMYAVFVPHITEFIYHKYYRRYEDEISIHLSLWEDFPETEQGLPEFGEAIKKILSDIRRFKTENGLSIKAGIESVFITAPADILPLIKSSEKYISACCSVKELAITCGENLHTDILI